MEHNFYPETPEEARNNGYVQDFNSNGHAQIYCVSFPQKLYGIGDYKVVYIICDTIRKCAIVLISTIDGLLGLLYNYWEA